MSARDMPILNARLPHDLDARFKAALAARKLTVTEGAREAVAQWIEGPRERREGRMEGALAIVDGVRRYGVATPEPANPLRALREAAGLTQRQAADACGIARRTWQIAEAAATAAPAMVARARKAMVRK
jgi:hypothetical protein